MSRADEIRVVTLPVERWADYRRLRLEALQDAPHAFGASYADSVDLPERHWRGRLAEAATGPSTLMFAEHDGELVGMLGSFMHAPDVAMVIAVYVTPAWRGQGIALRLLRAVLERLRATPGVRKATLAVNPTQAAAVRTYSHAGFAIAGMTLSRMGDGIERDELVMELEL